MYVLIRLGGSQARYDSDVGRVVKEPMIKRLDERTEEHIAPMQAQKDRRLSTAARSQVDLHQ